MVVWHCKDGLVMGSAHHLAAATASAAALLAFTRHRGSVAGVSEMACGRASEVSGISAPPQMNTRIREEEPFHNLSPPPVFPDHHHFIDPGISQSQPPIDDDACSLPEIDLFRDDDDDDVSRIPSDPEIPLAPSIGTVHARSPNLPDFPVPCTPRRLQTSFRAFSESCTHASFSR